MTDQTDTECTCPVPAPPLVEGEAVPHCVRCGGRVPDREPITLPVRLDLYALALRAAAAYTIQEVVVQFREDQPPLPVPPILEAWQEFTGLAPTPACDLAKAIVAEHDSLHAFPMVTEDPPRDYGPGAITLTGTLPPAQGGQDVLVRLWTTDGIPDWPVTGEVAIRGLDRSWLPPAQVKAADQ